MKVCGNCNNKQIPDIQAKRTEVPIGGWESAMAEVLAELPEGTLIEESEIEIETQEDFVCGPCFDFLNSDLTSLPNSEE